MKSSHSLLRRIRELLNDLQYHLNYFFGGKEWNSSKIKPLQQSMIDAFLPNLNPKIRLLLEKQLNLPYRVSFWHHGQISRIFFKDVDFPPELHIDDPTFAECLYKIGILVEGKKQIAHINFYDGRIFSIEFQKPLKFYDGKEITFGDVAVGKPKQSFSGKIDRREHGRDSR